ncbi:MAG TPA: lamin tail domain-containing protein [Chthoniobacteraceae bacterium]|nr:lamin tail domain-containing protein [Chthoniobacteraceae bacterium]
MSPALRFLVAVLSLACYTVHSLAQSVVINEIYYDPPDNTKAIEFVELHNPDAQPVDVSGWRLEDGVTFFFPTATSIPAGGYFVIAENSAAFQAQFGFAPGGVFTGGLSSDGERLQLRNSVGALVDEVTYSAGFPWPTAAKGAGASMELINAALDNDLGGSWRSSGTPDNPEPVITFIPPTDAAWRYRKGSSEASNPRTAWRQIGFGEDASWFTGRTSIGYADADDNTVLSDMQNVYWSLFFRHTFTVTAGQIPEALLLRVRVDDGCVVWINGQWVASFHTNTDDPLFNTPAQNHEGDTWDEKVIRNAQSFLVPGTNVIAILAANSSLNSSDFTMDAELKSTDPALNGGAPTPDAQNSVYSTNAAPAVRQVDHTPEQPAANVPVTITAKVTDPDGVASVILEYQPNTPGAYIRKSDAAYATTWTGVAMHDDGLNGDLVGNDATFSVVLPANVQAHRRLVRYRINVADTAGKTARVPYLDDEQPNFAYFVYNGAPAWTGRNQPPSSAPTIFPASLMTMLPTYHLIANETDVTNSQYNSAFDTVRMWGTLVYDGKVYDHIEFHNKGAASTYQSGKNKWRFHFTRARDFEARDSWGRKYGQSWDTFTLHACASPWNPCFRGWAGLDEVVSARVYALAGVPAPAMHHLHFRVIDNAAEAPADQYSGDMWGLYMAVEDPDGSFLDERGLPDGSVYHIAGNVGDKTHQGLSHPTDNSDWDTFRSLSQSTTTNNAANETWWRTSLDVAAYSSFHAANRITGNVDLREGFNHYFYHRGTDNRWLPIPWDLDMMYFPETHWSGTIDQKNALLMTGISLEYKNRCRELLDLICENSTATGGQIGQLVDEYKRIIRPAGQSAAWDLLDQYMWNYNPRTTGGHTGAFYLPNPTTDNRIGGTWTRTYTTADFNGICSFLINYATDTDPNTFAIGDGDQRGYGYNYLELEAADAAIPLRPTISYIGSAGFPANDLRFQSSAFADPQGAGTFAAMQWRIGEIAAPGVTGYVVDEPFTYEISDVWTSAEIAPFPNQIRVPTSVARPNHTYRTRVRMKDNTGRWSRWSPAVQFVAGTPNVSAYTSSLVVSEVMYHPAPVTPAEFAAGFGDEDFEYLEVRNVGATSIDLTNVRFTKGVDFDFAPGYTLAAGANALVVKNVAAFTMRYGAGQPIAGSYGSDSLSNGGEEIKLSYGAGTAIRDFIFSDAAPWPTAADGAGYSLVRRFPENTALDDNDPANWRASFVSGGTPGGDDRPSFDTWAVMHNAVDPLADLDLDGLCNAFEFALLGDPHASASAPRPTASVQVVNVSGVTDRYLTLTFRRYQDVENINYAVEFTGDLANWTTPGVFVSATDHGDGTRTEIWRAPNPVNDGPQLYGHLRVTMP